MKYYYKILILLTIIILHSCGSVTKVTGFWNEEDYMRKTYNKIGVIAITNNIQNRDVVETKFAEKFRLNGYQAVECSKFLTPKIMQSKDDNVISDLLEKNGIDGFLIVSVLDIKESTHYVPGTSTYYPQPYYGHYHDYYYYQYDRVNSPGYYEKTVQLFLESNFYNVNDTKLVSTIQSETDNPSDVYDLADSFSNTIVKTMIENGVIKKVVAKK